MKALEILKKILKEINDDNLFLSEDFISNIDIRLSVMQLEELENRSCWNCKYSEKTSGGVYCMCFSMHPDFEYCSDWKLKK